ncbi:hypothetical protein E2542_SST18588 [Spatholobus suberectus]|nr:hypothetical protein E2542_SST18588 [Spatholobus suberectus]
MTTAVGAAVMLCLIFRLNTARKDEEAETSYGAGESVRIDCDIIRDVEGDLAVASCVEMKGPEVVDSTGFSLDHVLLHNPKIGHGTHLPLFLPFLHSIVYSLLQQSREFITLSSPKMIPLAIQFSRVIIVFMGSVENGVWETCSVMCAGNGEIRVMKWEERISQIGPIFLIQLGI